MTSTLTCQELVTLVTEYLDAALPPLERARFEQHLATCADCSVYLHQMRRTVRLLSRLPAKPIDAVARQELLDVFRTWKERE